jgi:hypothetical protein
MDQPTWPSIYDNNLYPTVASGARPLEAGHNDYVELPLSTPRANGAELSPRIRSSLEITKKSSS